MIVCFWVLVRPHLDLWTTGRFLYVNSTALPTLTGRTRLRLIGGTKMTDAKIQSFGGVIRKRRRQLDLTQEEVARRIKTSVPYIGHLEAGKRHPSQKVVVKLSDALKLDGGELFLLANPKVGPLISEQQKADATPAWTAF